MQLTEAIVLDQTPLSGGYRLLRLTAPGLAEAARPGQFVHLRVPALANSALRRPFSIYRAEAGVFSLLYKNIGVGTEQMVRLAAGDKVSVIGPLGNGFTTDVGDRSPVLVAGGYGVAPLEFLARRLPVRGVLLVGGRMADDILCVDSFEALGWRVQVATQDGSRGWHGMVTDLLDQWHEANAAQARPVTPELFVCGPDGLLRAVGERAARWNCRAWLSLDHHMVCAVGACLACVQKLRRPDGTTYIGRVCYDGPVFESREIVWEAQA